MLLLLLLGTHRIKGAYEPARVPHAQRLPLIRCCERAAVVIGGAAAVALLLQIGGVPQPQHQGLVVSHMACVPGAQLAGEEQVLHGGGRRAAPCVRWSAGRARRASSCCHHNQRCCWLDNGTAHAATEAMRSMRGGVKFVTLDRRPVTCRPEVAQPSHGG
jgi:hypothetical protein